ncbi:zinc ribbon domain-containing protein [Flavihumibacter profundi]|uniref:zinc ribbon domain-containing protein n=1 Tax=Flavihumibacter profundi TaxID=2716883 RepID=UPI001CC80F78|nr:zinc ribbon domain-containing protein [Flavihumibacter profundi]MBZ5855586.1 zinc ribbon domain-containing protein [Flavihumibacter profundi]
MENKNFCQSCSMPIDKPELMGTEKDGSRNKEYCTYCYQNGSFVNPNMSLDEMKKLVKAQMEKMKIDTATINLAVSTLPHLIRWKTAVSDESI